MRPRYGIALILESAQLFAAAAFKKQGSNYGDYLAAKACGSQNALATTYSGAIVRSTHIARIVTDLGVAAGHFLRRDPVPTRQITIHLILIIGFIVGGLGYQQWGVNALLFPAAITGLTGAGYTIYPPMDCATDHSLHVNAWQSATPAASASSKASARP